jgi:hypothetical protein
MSTWKVTMELKGQLPNVKQQMGSILEAVASEARREWVKLARERLHSTSSTYIEAIGAPKRKGTTIEIKLGGAMPNMIENGCPPFDMKKGLLRSPKAKRDKKGNKYITVPLRMKSAGAYGGSPPVLPSPIYRQALNLKFGQSLTLPKKYEGWGLKTRLSADLKKWGHYTWKTSPFQGVTRVQRFPGLTPLGLPREKLGKMMTFRRVSTKSDPNSWIHPGFTALNLIEKTAEKVNSIFPKILDSVT